MTNSASSFGAYETARICVPGYYFATLLLCYLWALGQAANIPFVLDGIGLFVLFIGAGLIAGVTLYAKESTKKRKAFQENQPSLYLKTKARAMSDVPVMEETDARQLYFYILNNHVPSLFHEKVFFFGTMYHIMIQIRRSSLWFGVLSLVSLGGLAAYSVSPGALQTLIVFTVLSWLLYLLNVRYNKADRKMQENYQDQIYWLEMNNDLVESVIRKRYAATR